MGDNRTITNGTITEEALEKVAAGLSVSKGTLAAALATAGVAVLATGYYLCNKNKSGSKNKYSKQEIEMDEFCNDDDFVVLGN